MVKTEERVGQDEKGGVCAMDSWVERAQAATAIDVVVWLGQTEDSPGRSDSKRRRVSGELASRGCRSSRAGGQL